MPGYPGDGMVTTSVAVDAGRITSLLRESDGKMLAGGSGAQAGDYNDAIARYNADGTLDTTWGGTGIVISNFGGPVIADQVNDMVEQPDGKIVVVGNTDNSETDNREVQHERIARPVICQHTQWEVLCRRDFVYRGGSAIRQDHDGRVLHERLRLRLHYEPIQCRRNAGCYLGNERHDAIHAVRGGLQRIRSGHAATALTASSFSSATAPLRA